jgi:flagellar motility protein MotE (MotC chaperone)
LAESESNTIDEKLIEELQTRVQSVEGQIGALATDPRIGSALIRVAELEKKSVRSVSDPLLDEIARRLSALESDDQRSGESAALDDLREKLEKLESRPVSEEQGADARVDDLVIRMGSVEASQSEGDQDPRFLRSANA